MNKNSQKNMYKFILLCSNSYCFGKVQFFKMLEKTFLRIFNWSFVTTFILCVLIHTFMSYLFHSKWYCMRIYCCSGVDTTYFDIIFVIIIVFWDIVLLRVLHYLHIMSCHVKFCVTSITFLPLPLWYIMFLSFAFVGYYSNGVEIKSNKTYCSYDFW